MAVPCRLCMDGELVLRFCKGDEAAYAEIFRRYNGVLYSHAYNKLRNTDDAKDIVQDIFASLWDNRAAVGETENLAGYLYSSIRYKVINKQIRDKRISDSEVRVMEALESEAELADTRVRERELQLIIEAEVARLPSKMRQIFVLSRNEYLSHHEIAKQLNLSPTTVRKQVQNALKILRLKLGAFLTLIFIFFQ